MRAGLLRERATFWKRAVSADGYGNVEGAWEEQFTVAADIVFQRGGEEVQAQRLEGRQPVKVTLRVSSQTQQITTDWRMTDARSGAAFNIRSVVPGRKGAWIELLCEEGVADG